MDAFTRYRFPLLPKKLDLPRLFLSLSLAMAVLFFKFVKHLCCDFFFYEGIRNVDLV